MIDDSKNGIWYIKFSHQSTAKVTKNSIYNYYQIYLLPSIKLYPWTSPAHGRHGSKNINKNKFQLQLSTALEQVSYCPSKMCSFILIGKAIVTVSGKSQWLWHFILSFVCCSYGFWIKKGFLLYPFSMIFFISPCDPWKWLPLNKHCIKTFNIKKIIPV